MRSKSKQYKEEDHPRHEGVFGMGTTGGMKMNTIPKTAEGAQGAEWAEALPRGPGGLSSVLDPQDPEDVTT